jgi:transposase InsO family protein
VFVAVDHWNAECGGWHMAKYGDRYSALEPLAQGVTRYYGSVTAYVARGLAVRPDHGTQYLSDHLVNQPRFSGITPSFAFVAEPETYGVAERFIRTLKGAGHLRPDLPHRGRGPGRHRSPHHALQRRVTRREERLPEPAAGPRGLERGGGFDGLICNVVSGEPGALDELITLSR